MLVAELAARAFTPAPAYHLGMPIDPRFGFTLVPSGVHEASDERGAFSWRSSREGFRGPDLPREPRVRPDGEQRLLFLGDSFLQAAAVRDEELLTTRTVAALEAAGRRARAFTLCVADWGTAQELLALRAYGAAVDPDVVVLALFPANDLANNAFELAGTVPGSPGDYLRPYLVPDADGELELRHVHPLRAALRARSRLFALAERALLALGHEQGLAFLRPFDSGDESVRERLLAGRPPYPHQEILRAPAREAALLSGASFPGAAAWESAWERTEALVRAVRDEARARGARFVVLVIPLHEQVQRDALAIQLDLRAQLWLGRGLDELLDWNLPERRLSAFLAREGIENVLLLEPLRAGARAEPRGMYALDHHFLPAAHELAARALAATLLASSGRGAPLGPAFSAPVPLLGPASAAAARLDFERQPCLPYLVAGFDEWQPGAPHERGGWWCGQSAALVLPARRAPLFVRASAPERASYPFEVSLGVEGPGARASLVLEAPGAFELAVQDPLLEAFLPPAYDGFVPIQLQCSSALEPSAAGGARRLALLVHSIGFGDPAER